MWRQNFLFSILFQQVFQNFLDGTLLVPPTFFSYKIKTFFCIYILILRYISLSIYIYICPIYIHMSCIYNICIYISHVAIIFYDKNILWEVHSYKWELKSQKGSREMRNTHIYIMFFIYVCIILYICIYVHLSYYIHVHNFLW